jgi:hypothetical protein
MIEKICVAVKGRMMENKIACPKCRRPVLHTAIIDEAIKGEGSAAQSIICECGERITYWQITAQLRNQKTAGYRFKNWVRTLSHSKV